jgi:hypothetical protein
MHLNDVLEVLPPRVYLRRGELVIHFTSPGDLVGRIAETQAAFSELERPSDTGRQEKPNPTPSQRSNTSDLDGDRRERNGDPV